MKKNVYYLVFCIFAFATNASANPPCTISPITGPSNVCIGGVIALADASGGGSWSSSTPSVATIGTASGLVSPVTGGTTTITYTLSPGCTTTTIVTVGVAPAPIGGGSYICVGSSLTLSDATPGGTWISSDTTRVTVGMGTGIATATALGSATISYIVGGCSTTITELVNVAVPPIGTPTTPLCPYDHMTLSESYPGGTYTSANPGIATVAGPVVTGVSGGTTTITYTVAPACYVTTTVSINPGPPPFGGSNHVCQGATTTLTDALSGGTWSSSNPAIATITAGGMVSGLMGGLDTIYYTMPTTGCKYRAGFTVIDLPAIAGRDSLCAWGDTLSINESFPGGIYTSAFITVTNFGGGAGRVTANAPGIGTVTYMIPAGCSVTKTITVNPEPALIMGDYHVCTGFSSMLGDVTPGGTWSSGSANATVNSTTGVVTGVSLGTATIYYTLPTGCKVDTVVYVSAPPSAIAGVGSFCIGTSTTLTDSVSGGTWSSSYPPTATINPVSGIVTGYASASAIITYSLGGTCIATRIITVNPLPALYIMSGGGSYCSGGAGLGILLGGSQAGIHYQLYNGTTTVDTPLHGTGGSLNFGLQPGAGSYSIVASNPVTGCSTVMGGTAVINVNPLPPLFPVTGGGGFCAGGAGAHIGLGSSSAGIQYQLLFGGVPVGGTVAGTGSAIDFGLHSSIGIYTVTALNLATGCADTMFGSAVTSITPPVVPLVTVASSLGDTVCSGLSATFSAVVVNGGLAPTYQWKVNGTNVGSSTATYAYAPVNGDVVRVVMTSSANCATPDTASASVSMTVTTALVPSVTIVASPGTSIVTGQAVTFTASATNAGPSPTYQWLVNSVAITGATTSTYTSSTLNNGDVVLCVVTSVGPCGGHVGNSSVTMIVTNHVGIKNLVAGISELQVTPNPNKGEFDVTGILASPAGGDETVSLEITDMLGQLVYKGSMAATNGKLNKHLSIGKNMAAGLYVLNLRSGTGKEVVHLVIEQ